MDVLHFTRPRHIGDLVAYESDLNYCRDSVTLSGNLAGQLPHFSVVGVQENGSPSAVAAALDTNTGNFTVGNVSVAGGTPPGVYDLIMGNATNFALLAPGGGEVGHGALGTAFSEGGLGFTATAGGVAAVADDSATITVTDAAGAGDWMPVSASATDGTQHAKGISILDADATGGAVPLQILARGPMIVRAAELVWPSGATDDEIAAWTADLAALNPPIKVVVSG